MNGRMREVAWSITTTLCRWSSHWFGLGWVPGWVQYVDGHRLYFRRCSVCGAES